MKLHGTIQLFIVIFSVYSNPFNDYNTSVSEDFSNPSVKDEWDIEPPPIEDAGIPVRALYDFQGVEED